MKKKIESYIDQWENRCYSNGLPDFVNQRLEQLNKVPSYKQICKAIMKNDNSLEELGFSRTKSKYYSILKREELIIRGVIKEDKQLKLF